jgi:hypothetical protein
VTDEHPNPIVPEPEADPGADLAAEATPAASSASTGSAGPRRAVSSAATPPPRRPDYRGEELDPERGPGLGCFWFQVIVLGFFIVLIPIGLELNWPFELLAFLLFVVIGLLLLTGQSVIFLLRLVAADRRSEGRRRPLASSTKTVGELEDEQQAGPAANPTAANPTAVHPDSTADDGPGDAPADSSRDSESMNRELEVAETPPTEANAPVSAAADPDVDAAGTDAGDGAASRTDAGDGVPAVATGGGDEVAAAVRAHESSPESHETGAIRTADAGVPSTDEGAAAPAADADVDGDAPLPDALPDLPPDEASP